MSRRWIAWAAVLALALSVVAGLLALEGPDAARERRFDERRSQLLFEMARGVAVERELRRAWPDDPLQTLNRADEDALMEADWSYEREGATARLCLAVLRPDARPPLGVPALLFEEGGVVVEREDASPERLCYRLTDRRGDGGGG